MVDNGSLAKSEAGESGDQHEPIRCQVPDRDEGEGGGFEPGKGPDGRPNIGVVRKLRHHPDEDADHHRYRDESLDDPLGQRGSGFLAGFPAGVRLRVVVRFPHRPRIHVCWFASTLDRVVGRETKQKGAKSSNHFHLTKVISSL